MTYEPRFDIDYERGMVGERLVGTFLESLAGSKIEVKTDHRVNETGNVFVESHQKNHTSDWRPSGINTSESDFWCFAGPSGNGFITIKKTALFELAMSAPRATVNAANKETNSARGRLVKMADIIQTIYKG